MAGHGAGNGTGNATGNGTGSVAGNATGNATGNGAGSVTGNATGNGAGSVTGNATGNGAGSVTGNATGNATSHATGSGKRRRLSIPYSYKLMMTYLVFVLLAVIAIGTLAYRTSVNSIREQASENIQGILIQMKDNISYKAEEAKRISDQLYFDIRLQSYLRYYDSGWYSYDLTKQYMIPVFTSAMNVYRDPALLRIYLENTSMPEVYHFQDEAVDPIRSSPAFEILHYERLADADWLRALQLPEESYRGTEVVWAQVERDADFGNISLVRRLVDFEQRKPIGLVRTIIKLDNLLSAVDYAKIGDETEILVLDRQGGLVQYSGKEPEGAAFAVDRSAYLRIEQQLPELEMKLAVYIPNAFLIEDANRVREMTVLVCVISTLCLLVIGFFISGYFSRRVRKIIYSLRAFREGDFHKRVAFSGNDEFSQIGSAFNDMAEHIEELIKEVYLANLQRSEAEFESLQAQINPHFLYNTLSSMSRLAKLGEEEKLHAMIMGLAKFYRLTLNKGRSMISLYKELEQVRTYIEIQQIKLRDRFEVMYELDPAVFRYDTVKLILQPFVENALEHGLYGKRIHVRIVARKLGELIELSVIDDGVGMSQETIRQVFTADGIQVGYGIRNVDARIKLQFGPAYGVALHSIVGGGTCARITFPAFKEPKGGGMGGGV